MYKILSVAKPAEGEQVIVMPRISERRRLDLADFAKRLRVSIEATGHTQASFARSIGVDRGRLHHWIRGGSYPDPEKLLEMHRTHGLTCDWLLSGSQAGLPVDLAKKIQDIFQRMSAE